jgi:hypothetical protein
MKDSVPCMDAVVVGGFQLDHRSIETIVTFTIRYITNLTSQDSIS